MRVPLPLIAFKTSVIEKKPSAMLPTVNSDGSRNMPCAAVPGPSPWPVPCRGSGSQRASGRQYRQHARRALHPLAHLHPQHRVGRQQHIHARAKLDQPHALPALHRLAFAVIEHNPPRQQAAICLNVTSTPPSPRTVTIFCSLRSAEAGFMAFQIKALPIAHSGEHAANGRAVHMHIEDAQKDADPLPGPVGSGDRKPSPSPARLQAKPPARACRNRSLRIAEKPQKKCRQKHRRNAHAQPPVAHTSATATASKLKP